MSDFFQMFIELSMLDSLESIENELDVQTRQIQEQIQHEEDQLILKNYIFGLSKNFRDVESQKETAPGMYYSCLYFLFKGLFFSGINEDCFDEIQEKEYFYNFRKNLLEAIKAFEAANGELDLYNELIQRMESRNLLSVIYNSHRSRVEVDRLKKIKSKTSLFDSETKHKIDENIAQWQEVGIVDFVMQQAIADFMPEALRINKIEDSIDFVDKVKNLIDETDSFIMRFMNYETFLHILKDCGEEEINAIVMEYPVDYDKIQDEEPEEEIDTWICPKCGTFNSEFMCTKCGNMR